MSLGRYADEYVDVRCKYKGNKLIMYNIKQERNIGDDDSIVSSMAGMRI